MLKISMQCIIWEVAEARDFLEAFDALARAVRRARGAAGATASSLTLSQYGLLEPLIGQGSARVRELASQAGISAPTATRILDTLERRGLVQRTRAREDRRGVRVGLTGNGRRVLVEQHDWVRARQRAFYESLTGNQQALAPDLLVKLAALIDELAPGTGS
jgi:MarR family transcriptional regulator, organic hydroperoxide resistance regulator